MIEAPVWVDGELVPARTPVVPAEDLGFQLGLAVFETVLVEAGHAYFLDEHLARLRAGAESMDISWPEHCEPRDGVRALIETIDEPRFAARITVTAGVPADAPGQHVPADAPGQHVPADAPGQRVPTDAHRPRVILLARAAPLPPTDGVTALVSSVRTLEDALATVKATSRLRYVAAQREARRAGAWEALLLNGHGRVAEGAVSNVFAVVDDVLRTPTLAEGCLPGIVRGRLLAAEAGLAVASGPITLDELFAADEVFLTNTTGRVVPLVGLSSAEDSARHRTLPGPRGPRARAAAAELARQEAEDRVKPV